METRTREHKLKFLRPELPAYESVEKTIENERSCRSTQGYFTYLAQRIYWFALRNFFDRVKFLEWKVYSGLRLPLVQSENDIADSAHTLFREYVQFKLHRRGLLSSSTSRMPKKGKTEFSLISYELQITGMRLESMYPELYSNIACQLNVTMTSERVVEDLCQLLADKIFEKGISWAKIVSFYAVASTIVIECFEQCNGIYIHSVMRFIQEYVRTHLAGWIQKHGGWRDIVRSFRGYWIIDFPLLCIAFFFFWFFVLYVLIAKAGREFLSHLLSTQE